MGKGWKDPEPKPSSALDTDRLQRINVQFQMAKDALTNLNITVPFARPTPIDWGPEDEVKQS